MRTALEVTQSVHGVVRASWHADPWEGVVLGPAAHLAPEDEVAGTHTLAFHDGAGWKIRAWPHWVAEVPDGVSSVAGLHHAPLVFAVPADGSAVEVVLGAVRYRFARVVPAASVEAPVEGSHMAAFAGIFLAALGTTGVLPAASAAAVVEEVRREEAVFDLQALLGTPRESFRKREGEALRRVLPPPQEPEPERFAVAAPAWEGFVNAPPADADPLGARLAPVLSLRSVTPTADLTATIPLCGTGPLYTGDVCDPDVLGERIPWVTIDSGEVAGLLARLRDGSRTLEAPLDNWQRYHRYWEMDRERAGWRWNGPDRWSQAVKARAAARCGTEGRGLLRIARYRVTPEGGKARAVFLAASRGVAPATLRCFARVLRSAPAPAEARTLDLWVRG